jgi:hypothetical protein
MAQTAVDFVEYQLFKYFKLYQSQWEEFNEVLNEAKEIEKEQTVNAWERGQYIGMSFPQRNIPNEYEQDGVQYYNHAYNRI